MVSSAGPVASDDDTAAGRPPALVTIDARGIVLDFDPAAERLTGYPRADAVGRRLSELLVPVPLRWAYEAGLRRMRETGPAPLLDGRLDVPVLCRDGREIRAELVLGRSGPGTFTGSLRRVDDPPRIPVEVLLRARTAERHVREHAARMTALIESLGVGVLLQDQQRRVVLTNSTFVDMFDVGLSPDRLRGEPIGEDVTALRLALADQAPVARTEEIMLPDGRVLERDHIPVTLDGAMLGRLWVFRDVTTRTEIHHSLQERNRIITELSALKTEFVAVISHELRTPLTSIATFATMLDEEGLAPGEAEHRRAIAAIRRNTGRMLVLIADLILLAKLESGELVLQVTTVDAARLVRVWCERYGRSSALRVETAPGHPLTGDEVLLEQAVGMAVGVVAAAADPGAEVRVEGRFDERRWTLTVATHTGAPASTERLLSPRLPHPDSPDEHRTGALALMLAREIAARHGGQLTTAVDARGMTVTLTLPTPPA